MFNRATSPPPHSGATSPGGGQLLNAIQQERVVEVVREEIQENIIEVPEVSYVEKIVEVPVPVYLEKLVHVPKIIPKETVRYVKKPVVQQKIVELPEIQYYEKYVEVPHYIEREKVVEVPKVMVVERVIPVLNTVKKERQISTPWVDMATNECNPSRLHGPAAARRREGEGDDDDEEEEEEELGSGSFKTSGGEEESTMRYSSGGAAGREKDSPSGKSSDPGAEKNHAGGGDSDGSGGESVSDHQGRDGGAEDNKLDGASSGESRGRSLKEESEKEDLGDGRQQPHSVEGRSSGTSKPVFSVSVVDGSKERAYIRSPQQALSAAAASSYFYVPPLYPRNELASSARLLGAATIPATPSITSERLPLPDGGVTTQFSPRSVTGQIDLSAPAFLGTGIPTYPSVPGSSCPSFVSRISPVTGTSGNALQLPLPLSAPAPAPQYRGGVISPGRVTNHPSHASLPSVVESVAARASPGMQSPRTVCVKSGVRSPQSPPHSPRGIQQGQISPRGQMPAAPIVSPSSPHLPDLLTPRAVVHGGVGIPQGQPHFPTTYTGKGPLPAIRVANFPRRPDRCKMCRCGGRGPDGCCCSC